MKEKPKYKIKYPYTVTIALLTFINGIITTIFINQDNYKHIISYTIFCTVFGAFQIYGLLNLPSRPAWEFPKGSAFFQDIGIKYKYFTLEDLFFIPNCSLLFYWFMYFTREIPDYINNEYIIMIGLSIFVIIEAIIYDRGGKGCQKLMIGYTLIPIIVLLIIDYKFKLINITHAAFSLAFIAFINCGWELFNAWRRHWFYNIKSDVFGKKGWILNGKLHISIFIQYFISGWVVAYFSYLYFGKLFLK